MLNLNTKDFISDINKLVSNGVPMIDAIVDYCEKHNIELDVAASIIKSNPKSKLKVQIEAEDLNFLPKKARLNI